MLTAEEEQRRCLHSGVKSTAFTASVAVGNDHTESTNTAAREDEQTGVVLPHPPPQPVRGSKQVDGRQKPDQVEARPGNNRPLDRGRKPLLPLLFSGVEAEAELKSEAFLPAGGRHIAERKSARKAGSEQEVQDVSGQNVASEEDELAEEMEALHRARLSRQITEERFGKKPQSGRRKTRASK